MSEFPDLEAYRRGPKGDIDRFLGFWIELIVEGKQARSGAVLRRARRAVQAFLGQRAVRATLDAGGDEVLAEALSDAAKVYFETCQTDSQYGALLFGTKRMSADQVRAKAARETTDAVGLLGETGLLQGFAARLPKLLVEGFLGAFDGDAAGDLRAAISRSDSATRVAELLW